MDDILKAFKDLFGDGCSVAISTTKQGKTLSEFTYNETTYQVTSAKLSDENYANLKRLLKGLPEIVYPAANELEPEQARYLAEALMSIQIEKTVKVNGHEKNWVTFSPITQIIGNHEKLNIVYYDDEAKAVLYRALGLSH